MEIKNKILILILNLILIRILILTKTWRNDAKFNGYLYPSSIAVSFFFLFLTLHVIEIFFWEFGKTLYMFL